MEYLIDLKEYVLRTEIAKFVFLPFTNWIKNIIISHGKYLSLGISSSDIKISVLKKCEIPQSRSWLYIITYW